MKNYWDKFTDIFGNTIFHPQFIMLGYTRKAVEAALKYAKGDLIDIGCGRMPYRKAIEPKVEKYIGLDHPSISKFYQPDKKPDILADITKKLPIKNSSFDTVLMLQVMEYLQDPQRAIDNIEKILKPGGVVIISSPFLYPLHDIPFDKIRLTDTFLKNVIQNSGLKIIKINIQGGFWGFWLQSLEIFLFKKIMDIIKGKKDLTSLTQLAFLTVITPIIVIFANLAYLLFLGNKKESKYPNYFPLNYLIVARKQTFRT